MVCAENGKEGLEKVRETLPDIVVSDIIQESGSIQLSPLDKEFIARLHKLVEDNIEIEDMDMPFLTDKMCMSHSTLYRKVKSITGLTPVEFTRKIKLNKAKQLLMSEEVDPAEIPFLTGFNSSAYFRRVFKKEFGVTPKEMLQEKKDNRNQNITN